MSDIDDLDNKLVALLQRTIDREDPDRQYIGYLASKITSLIAQEVAKAKIDEIQQRIAQDVLLNPNDAEYITLEQRLKELQKEIKT